MAHKSKRSKLSRVRVDGYDAMLAEMVGLLETARRISARAINSVITSTYWQIGRRIVGAEQTGNARADYGDKLLKRLAADLTGRFGRGFSWRNLYQMRGFYLAYPEILQTASAKSPESGALPILPKKSAKAELAILQTPSAEKTRKFLESRITLRRGSK
jgi:hypothetical protein